MIHVQQLIDAAIAAAEALQIKSIELGTSHTESRHSTTQLFEHCDTYVEQTVVFKANSMQCSTEKNVYSVLYCATAYSATIRCCILGTLQHCMRSIYFNTCYRGDNKHC